MIVFLVTVGCRLIPVLRGGGFFSLGAYDDGVHYAAAVGLINGRMPYEDFLFLQPPGILILLAPIAVFGELTSDSLGLAVARGTWMLLGGLNAVLVTRVLRPLGMAAALLGGLFYAVFYPAIHAERTVMLEAVGTTTILAALLALRVGRTPGITRWVSSVGERLALIGAGAALGIGAGVKLWGVVALVIVLGWHFTPRRIRGLPWLALGVLITALPIYLPFFLRAPWLMWRYVVLDQVHRPTGKPTWSLFRAERILGLDLWHPTEPWVIIAGSVLAVLALAVAITVPTARLAVVISVGYLLLLMLTPNLYRQYPAVLAGPAAVCVGAAVHRLTGLIARPLPRRGPVTVVITAIMIIALVGYAAPLRNLTFGERFPREDLAEAVRPLPGCITSDDVAILIQLDVLSRNLDRDCRLVVDYGGYAYDPPGTRRDVRSTRQWQAAQIAYLSHGSAAFHVRNRGHGEARRYGLEIWRSWPVLAKSGDLTLRRPPG